ncbi:MAG TPA: metallophosphoesterase [Vicinamibacterales bacterium]|nr:metallophosphoesterase [Vicinamibacterales bacterium]
MRRRSWVLAGGLLVLACWAANPRAQPAPATPCQVTTTERIVAIGDVHGAHDQFVAILRAAGLVNTRDRWSGGRAVLIQTGDVLDRGKDSRKTLDLLRRLERDARGAGGQVIALTGNHEFMRLAGDWRYVSAGEYGGFRDGTSVELREAVRVRATAAAEERARAEQRPFDAAAFKEQFLKEVPLGLIEMRQAFAAGTTYGDWLRARPAVARVNGVLFLHGGISDEVAALGCEAINDAVAKDMKGLPGDPAQIASLFSSREVGPLWYRGLAQEPESEFAPTLDSILKRMGARAIVVGHTPAVGRIMSRFGGRVVQIDSGMLGGTFYPGGAPSALVIEGGTMTALYLDRREPLGALPTS